MWTDLAPDKKLHLAAGLIIGFVGATWFPAGLGTLPGFLVSPFVAGVVGILKELVWDKWMGKGTPEFADAAYTFGGGCITTIAVAFANSGWPV